MTKNLVALALIIILIPLGGWWFSTEQILKRRTSHLMEVVSLDKRASVSARQAKVYSMNGLLSDEVELVVPNISDATGIFDKQELESAFSWICQNAQESEFRIDQFQKVGQKDGHATIHFIAEGFIEVGGIRQMEGQFRVKIYWQKNNSIWKIYKIDWNAA